MTMSWFKVTFWGVRGSIPTPGRNTMRYGGNTACLEIRTGEGDWIIFDAGTGLRVLGESLDLSKKYAINLFISHPHWDHINGFPFFTPIYIPGNEIVIYGPGTFESSLEGIIGGQMKYTYFPVRTQELLAKISYHQIEQESFTLGNFRVESIPLNHPVACLGYRIIYRDKVFIYLGDNEPYYNIYKDDDQELAEFTESLNTRLRDFVKGADILVTDAQYLPSEYESKRGWGHSHTHHVMNLAVSAGVKKLFFFHHEPLRTDDELDGIVEFYRGKIREKGLSLELYAAAEGTTHEV